MLLAFVLLNVVHPGRIMPGNISDIPSRKERKRTGISYKIDPIESEQTLGDVPLSVVDMTYKSASPELSCESRK